MKWKKLIRTLAPTISTALGGPLAGTATRYLLGEFLGGEGTEAQLEEALKNASPDQLARIKEIDNKFQIDMERIGVDLAAMEIDDRKDARSLARVNMWPQMILSVIFITGYFSLLSLVFSGKIAIDDSIRDMSNILIGVMTVNIPMIMQFWFGSSHGSKQKTKSIEDK